MSAPPRVCERLLRRLLDPASYEAVAGDLAEEYLGRHARQGAIAARLWYVREAVRSVVACRITGRRRAHARRLDFDAGAPASVRDLLRPALRQFRDQPLYAAACSGTLALAIGAACASLAVVKAALLDPLPYRDGDAIVSILTRNDGPLSAVSPHVLEDLRAGSPPLIEFAAVRPGAATYAGHDGSESLGVNFVTPEYFSLLGVQPAAGRLWRGGEADAVVVSWAFWQRALAGEAQALGSIVRVDGLPLTVIGVLPADFIPPYWPATALWRPLDLTSLLADLRARRTLTVLARRAAHASRADLDGYLHWFSSDLQRRYPGTHAGQTWVAVPLRDEMIGDTRPALIGTAAAALLLVLIVGANIAGLSTAQALATRHRLAVRAALGATRGRLFVEQLVDCLVLAAVGAIGGVWLARLLVAPAAGYQRQFLERLPPIALDAPTMLLGLAIGMMVGVVAALVPRGVINARRPFESLRAARGSASDRGVASVRKGLVIVQVALALALSVEAGLLVRTVRHLADLPLGFHREGLTTFNVNLPGAKYASPAAQVQFERDVLVRLQQIHGVSSASASIGIPVIGGMGAALTRRGQPAQGPHEIAYFSVAPGFLPSVGARFVAGRDLDPADDLSAPRVVVVNETMARTFWPDGAALGTEVQIGAGAPNQPWIRIVGIVADLRQHGPTEAVRPTAFGSTHQYSWPRRHFTVHTSGERPISLAMELRAAVKAVDPSIAVGAVTPLEQLISDRTARHRLVTFALTVFGGVALVLWLSGLYATVALAARLRRREYAIRLALGARRGRVRWMVMRQGLGLAAAGTILGLGLAAIGARSTQSLFHGVPPADAATFAAAAAALLGLSALAAWQPARRAERVDPAETLKAE